MTREELYERLMADYAGDKLEEMGGVINQLREIDNLPVNAEMYVARGEYDALKSDNDGLKSRYDALREQYINTFFGRQAPEDIRAEVENEVEESEPEDEEAVITFESKEDDKPDEPETEETNEDYDEEEDVEIKFE